MPLMPFKKLKSHLKVVSFLFLKESPFLLDSPRSLQNNLPHLNWYIYKVSEFLFIIVSNNFRLVVITGYSYSIDVFLKNWISDIPTIKILWSNGCIKSTRPFSIFVWKKEQTFNSSVSEDVRNSIQLGVLILLSLWCFKFSLMLLPVITYWTVTKRCTILLITPFFNFILLKTSFLFF